MKEFQAKSVEEAIQLALDEWQVDRHEINVEVVDAGSKGIFGFGQKDAKIQATLVSDKAYDSIVEATSPVLEEAVTEVVNMDSIDAEVVDVELADVETVDAPCTDTAPVDKADRFDTAEQAQAAEAAKQFLQSCTDAMGLSVMIEKMVQPERVLLHLRGRGLGVLIGRRGKTLNELQYLTNLAANKDVNGRYFIMIDVEDYRAHREDTLVALANRTADKVKRYGESIHLEPMNAYERKVIHLALQDDPEIETLSEGENRDRHLVVHYRKS